MAGTAAKQSENQPETDEKEELAGKPEPKPEPPKVKEDDDGNVTVQLDEEDKPERKPRRQRRDEHAAEEARRWREEAESWRTRAAAMQSELAARIQQGIAPQQQGDPYEAELGEIRSQQELIQGYLRNVTPTDQGELDRLKRSFYTLENRRVKLDRDRLKKELANELRQEQQGRQGEVEEALLRNEFPDVIANPHAVAYARGLYYQMTADLSARGRQPTIETTREALRKAGEWAGVRQPSMAAPSDAQRARYGAVSNQAGGGARGGEIRLDAAQKKLALARWPKEDEHVAFTKMAALIQRRQQAGTDEGQG